MRFLRTLLSSRIGVAVVALLVVIAGGLLSGPPGFRPEPQSAEAALLNKVTKLHRL